MTDFIQPFQLIANNHLGLDTNSLSSYVSSRLFGQAKIDIAVNAGNGNVCVIDHQLSFPDIGTTIDLAYVYNSLSQENSPWQLAYGRKIKSPQTQNLQNSIKIIERDGNEVAYEINTDYNETRYVAKEDKDGDAYVVYKSDVNQFERYDPKTKITEIFNKEGLLVEQINATGNKISYQYEGDQLKKIIAPSGLQYVIKKEQNQTSIYLQTKEKEKLLHQYEIDPGSYLVKSKTDDGYVTTYQANKEWLLESISQTDGSNLKFTYHKDTKNSGKIATLRMGYEGIYTFNYESIVTTITDPAHNQMRFTFNEERRPKLFSNADTHLEYKYDENNGKLQAIIYPDKSEEIFLYNQMGLIETHIRRDGTAIKREYTKGLKPQLLREMHYEKNGNNPVSVQHYAYEVGETHSLLRFAITQRDC
jgi:hypothetical protein